MNNYNCEIIADSINTFGNRITTFKLTYPRIVHAELMTHRLFSRNAASSRAIPVRKMIESVRNNMFTPLAIQKAHKGMQGTDYFEGVELEQAKQLWIESAELAIQQAEKMEKFGISKQIVNRVVEPYQYYQVLVTATEWENFFELRCPKYTFNANLGDGDKNYVFKSKKDALEWFDKHIGIEYEKPKDSLSWLKINKSQAEIHIQKIAEMMFDAYNESIPKQLEAFEWHIPFGDKFDSTEMCKLDLYTDELDSTLIKIATARAARISYTTLGDNPKIDYEADIKLHNRLLEYHHMSPFEHCARAMSEEEYCTFIKGKSNANWDTDLVTDNTYEISAQFDHNVLGWCNNYRGFIQYRYLVENQ